MNEAGKDEKSQEDTIGFQAIKELRRDFEKAGLLNEKGPKKKKKSILQEDYKKILNKAGELIKYIRAIKSHPDRIHPELWYNEEKMANDGALCRCSTDQKRFSSHFLSIFNNILFNMSLNKLHSENQTFIRGINHGIYPGELVPPALDSTSNNLDKLFHYRVAISPKANFTFKDHLQAQIKKKLIP